MYCILRLSRIWYRNGCRGYGLRRKTKSQLRYVAGGKVTIWRRVARPRRHVFASRPEEAVTGATRLSKASTAGAVAARHPGVPAATGGGV